jgi:hypothetical protein
MTRLEAQEQDLFNGHTVFLLREVREALKDITVSLELLNRVRWLFSPIPDAKLFRAVERAWCARTNEEGLQRQLDEARQPAVVPAPDPPTPSQVRWCAPSPEYEKLDPLDPRD